DESKIMGIIKDEAMAIRKRFADERRTEIQTVSGEVDIEDLIPVEECVLTLTHYGYIKRLPVDVYKTQRRGGRGVSGMTTREEDFAEELFICSSHDYVMFFTNKGKTYRMKCYEVPQGSRTSKGTNIVNLLPLEAEEKVTSMIRISDFEDGMYLVMVTRNGIIKRTDLTAYRNVRKGGLIAISLDEDDELAWVRLTNGACDLIVATKNGMAIRFHETDASPLGRSARGVKAITLDQGDSVVGMARIREDATLLTVSDRGLGRRTALDEYRLQSRGGKGIINYKTDDEKGLVAGIKVVDETDDIIMITNEGVIIRIPVEQINVQSRYAQGVRAMRVSGEERIVTIARAPQEESIEEDTCECEQPAASEPEQTTEAPADAPVTEE
ncbi:MAG: DNA gyrase C-terminal beta-propeller domain-containing protein, partial [Oscillospiraceae bacterium]